MCGVRIRPGVLAALTVLLIAGPARPQGAPDGTQFVIFWRGDLRIFATRANTMVSIVDVSTGNLLPATSFVGDFTTNPFVLVKAGDSFEGSSQNSAAFPPPAPKTYRVRILTSTAGGPVEDKPVVVFSGDLETAIKHPAAPPTVSNAWASYLPASAAGSIENGTEIGREFWGFTSREMYVMARKGAQPTSIQIQDLTTNVDPDSNNSVTLTPVSPYKKLDDGFIEGYYLDGFNDDTVHVTANTDIEVMVGAGTQAANDWTVTPSSFGAAEDGRELGTLFYAFVSRDMTIFPTEDNTMVSITDLSDGDDSLSFTLAHGSLAGAEYDIFVTDTYARNGTGLVPRTTGPKVNLTMLKSTAPFDNDWVKVVADKPILVYVGPKASDTGEYADVAYTVRAGPSTYLIYDYAQNGGAEDLQIFAFSSQTNVSITSLSYTAGFGSATHHDWSIPNPTPWKGGNASYNDYYWADGGWAGELQRIVADAPLTIIDGDYDGPNFGCFIPFVADSTLLKPIARAGPDLTQCPDSLVFTFDGTASFDQDTTLGGQIPRWTWDVDASVDSDKDGDYTNDKDATGAIVNHTYAQAGTYAVTLTYTDDDGQSDTDVLIAHAADLSAPTVQCPLQALADAGPTGSAFVQVVAQALDDCDPAPLVRNDRTAGGSDASDTYPCGLTKVVFTATDSGGLSSNCQTVVTLNDKLAPVLNCPPLVQKTSTGPSGAVVTLAATGADNCDPGIAIANDRTGGGADATDTYPCGETAVTFRAVDSSGNQGTCTSKVRVLPIAPLPRIGDPLKAAKETAEDIRWGWALTADPVVSYSNLYSSAEKDVPLANRTQVFKVPVPKTSEVEVDGITLGAALTCYQLVTAACDGSIEGPY